MTSLEAAARRAMHAAETDQGRAVRAWDSLPPLERKRWRAVARAVLDPSAPSALFRAHELEDEPGTDD